MINWRSIERSAKRSANIIKEIIFNSHVTSWFCTTKHPLVRPYRVLEGVIHENFQGTPPEIYFPNFEIYPLKPELKPWNTCRPEMTTGSKSLAFNPNLSECITINTLGCRKSAWDIKAQLFRIRLLRNLFDDIKTDIKTDIRNDIFMS